MYHPYSLLLLLCLCQGVCAQQTPLLQLFPESQPQLRACYEQSNRFLSQYRPSATAGKTTALKQRVIAENTYSLRDTGIALYDSVRYFYSGTRGSTFDLHYLDYHTVINPIDQSTIGDVQGPVMQLVLCDSAHLFRGPISLFPGTWLEEVQTFAYNGDNDFTATNDRVYDPFQGFSSMSVYTLQHNAQGRRNKVEESIFSGNTWTNSRRLYSYYNAQGQRTLDSISFDNNGNPYPASRQQYTYNAGGQLVTVLMLLYSGGQWNTGTRTDFSYYTNGKLKELRFLDIANGTATLFFRDSLGYPVNSNQYNWRSLWYSNGQGFAERSHYTRHFNAQDLPDTVTVQLYNDNSGLWDVIERDWLQYNSWGNPTEAWKAVPGEDTSRHRFFYEEYDDPTKIAGVSPAAVKVYPNPVGASLQIEWKDAAPNKPVVVTLSNSTGQKVYCGQRSGKGQSQQISTASLAPGLYLLSITDAEGRPLYRQKVVKQ